MALFGRVAPYFEVVCSMGVEGVVIVSLLITNR